MPARPLPALAALALAASLSACATGPGPVEVTRFVAPDRTAQLGRGAVFVATPEDEDSLALSPYKQAVAAELTRLGYRESARTGATQIADVRIERYMIEDGARQRGPVSVGAGGSTGSYGSGVGVGVGINLGALGGSRNRVGTELAVAIRDAASGAVLWEGRADFDVGTKSALAQDSAAARTLAAALFEDFPGNSGETVTVEVSE